MYVCCEGKKNWKVLVLSSVKGLEKNTRNNVTEKESLKILCENLN